MFGIEFMHMYIQESLKKTGMDGSFTNCNGSGMQ